MRYLLDTQVLIWLAHNDRRLRPSVAETVLTGDTWVSVASLWEIAIKRAIGKLDIPEVFLDWVNETGFPLLQISVDHVWATRTIPLHHRDPFDRLLITQARSESMTLVTSDAAISLYDVETLRA